MQCFLSGEDKGEHPHSCRLCWIGNCTKCPQDSCPAFWDLTGLADTFLGLLTQPLPQGFGRLFIFPSLVATGVLIGWVCQPPPSPHQLISSLCPIRSLTSTWSQLTTCPWGRSRMPSFCEKASMWRYLILPILCAGLYAPSPPNPALLGRAGCRLPTWTRGSRYLAGKIREEGLQVTGPEDSGIVVPLWSQGPARL